MIKDYILRLSSIAVMVIIAFAWVFPMLGLRSDIRTAVRHLEEAGYTDTRVTVARWAWQMEQWYWYANRYAAKTAEGKDEHGIVARSFHGDFIIRPD